VIPVLIAPAYNRHDLLHRMLRSVDVEVGHTLIFDNGRNYEGIPDDLRGTVVTPPLTSMGYGGSINFGIAQSPHAPWWMWASNDVEFLPGHLATVVERMQVTSPRIVTGGFTWGAVNRALIDEVGLVDDWSFFPIYFDDNDFEYRCKLAGVEWIEDWATGSRHGDERHGASLTIQSDPKAMSDNGISFTENRLAYIAKWGGLPREERFTTPWDSGLPLWATRPNMAGRKSRTWR
jgi:hypothetical protein